MEYEKFKLEVDQIEVYSDTIIALVLETRLDDSFVTKILKGTELERCRKILKSQITNNDPKPLINKLQLIYLSQVVDILEIYVKGFIKDSYTSNPEYIQDLTVKNLEMRDILNCKSVKEAVSVLLDTFLESLGNTTFDNLIEHLKTIQKQKSRKIIEDLHLDRVKSSRKIRNLFIHNNGKINKQFIKSGFNGYKENEVYSFKRGEFHDRLLSILMFAKKLHFASPKIQREIMMNVLKSLADVKSS